MNVSERVKTILRALEYTPGTLAKDMGISLYKAKRILRDGGKIKSSEFYDICLLTGISPNLFYGYCRR